MQTTCGSGGRIFGSLRFKAAGKLFGFLLIAMLAGAGGEVRADGWRMGVDVYGRSYHHDLAPGERDKLNESNIGWGIHAARTAGRHRFTVETGTFLNSYYDQAYWLGAHYSYRLFRHFEAGYMVRHWETDHGTYPEKAFSKYLTVAIPITDRVRGSFIVRGAGIIAYGSVDFK